MNEISYNYVELLKIKRQIENKIQMLDKELLLLKNRLLLLNSLIKENDDNAQDWLISLPAETFTTLQLNNSNEGIKQRIKWQETILDIMESNDIPMDLTLLYNKVRQNPNSLHLDRRTVQKNLSAALTTLCNNGRLFKMRISENKKFMYCFSHHFDEAGNVIREKYLSRFKIESEGSKRK